MKRLYLLEHRSGQIHRAHRSGQMVGRRKRGPYGGRDKSGPICIKLRIAEFKKSIYPTPFRGLGMKGGGGSNKH
jgi:hypothetical protein